jgi:hypothetical protein
MAFTAVTVTLGNLSTIQQQAAAALAANRTYYALAAPTLAQVTAQVKALTRQANGLIRLALDDLTGTN